LEGPGNLFSKRFPGRRRRKSAMNLGKFKVFKKKSISYIILP
jgi:hypothetical protein